MTVKNALIFVFLIGIISGLIFCSQKFAEDRKELFTLLPDQNQLKDWKPFGEPQYAEGEDLFLLINGGAEIYYEYGFKRAVIHSYSHKDGTSINVEIYEMEDAVSAYGMYSFKIGGNGKDIPIGTEGRMEEYYLNFWKGPYVVTLIGFDTDSATRESLKKIAGTIDDKITEKGTPPALTNYLTNRSDSCLKITYIEGNLGLYNQYEFDTENIFGVTKGVVGEYKGYKLFLLHYPNSSVREEWFQNAEDHLKGNSKFSDYLANRMGFTLKDRQGQLVWVTSFKDFILVYVGEDDLVKVEDVLERVRKGV